MEKRNLFQGFFNRLKNSAGGTHVCYFYHTMEDLFDILLPYFAEGLADNEFCLWICPPLIEAEEARNVLKDRLPLPQPEKYFRTGQIKILDADRWYLDPGTHDFRPEIPLQRGRALYTEAMQKDFSGFRSSGDTSWLTDESWPAFMEYERLANQAIANYNIHTICSYPLSRCGPSEIMDVASCHRISLLRTSAGCKLFEHDERPPAAGPTAPLHASQDEIRSLSISVLAAREEERKKISTSLHSSIGSLAIALSSRLQSVEQEIKTRKPADALRSLREIHPFLKSEVKKIKHLAYSIRPPELDFGGFPEVADSFFSGLAREKGVDFRFHFDPACNLFSQQESTILFRIAHEAFNNVLKHARASTLKIHLSQKAGKICLYIQDDGRGFDPEKALLRSPSTLGLLSMKEMAESLGGTLQIQSSPEKGTRVEVLIPKSNP